VFIRSFSNPAKVEVFSEHKVNVNCATFSPNGEWVASGDSKGRVFIWAAKSQTVKIVVEINKNVVDVQWSADGQRLVAVGDGSDLFGKTFIWNTGNTVGDLTAHSKIILAGDFKSSRPFRVATASEDGNVNFYEGPPFKLSVQHKVHMGRYPTCIRFSPDGNRLVSVGADKKIVLYDSKSGEQLKEIESPDAHSGSIVDVCWSPDNVEFATASLDKTIKIWHAEECKNVASLNVSPTPEVEDQQVAVLWHSSHLVSISFRGNINFFDRKSPSKPKKILRGHQAQICAMGAHKASHTVFTADITGRVMKWEAKSADEVEATGENHKSVVLGLDVSLDGSRFYTIGVDDKLQINECKSMEHGQMIPLESQPAGIVSSSKDADVIYVATKGKKLFKMRNGLVEKSFDLSFKPSGLAVAPNDTEIAVFGVGSHRKSIS
jgi:WD40 repeat protein